MYIWVVSLWLISLLMACWSFSLLVRWVSDWNARRHHRLTPMYSKNAFRLAPILMAVCAGVAIVAGYWAEHLASLYGDYLGIFRSPIGVVSLIFIAGGLMWLVLCTVGDRARGRVRCPKCWYDMSDVPGLLCPECGRESKSRSQHTRTRRPRWAFVLAGISIGLGAYGVSVNRRVILIDPLAAVPTWVLMAGWEVFPTHWVYDDGTVKPDGSPVALESCLQNRLGDEDWVSKARAVRFARRLAKPMLRSKEARWDAKRLGLLSALYMQISYWRAEDSYPEPPKGIDHGELLRLCAIDITEALQAEHTTILDDIILDSAHDDTKSAYKIARRWVLRSFDPQSSIYFSTYLGDRALNAHLQSVLRPIFNEINQHGIVEKIHADDRDQRSLAIRLMIDSKVLNLHYSELVKDIDLNLGKQLIWENAHYYAQIAQTLPDEKQVEANEMIMQWLESSSIAERVFALRVVGVWVRLNNQIPEDQPKYEVAAFIDLVQAFSIGDARLIDGPQYPASTVHSLAVWLILDADQTGLISFPLMGERLKSEGTLYGRINAMYHQDEWTDESFKAWLDAVDGLAQSLLPESRVWILENFPTRSDSAYEKQLIEIATSLVHDPEKEIEMKARKILWDRGIDLP